MILSIGFSKVRIKIHTFFWEQCNQKCCLHNGSHFCSDLNELNMKHGTNKCKYYMHKLQPLKQILKKSWSLYEIYPSYYLGFWTCFTTWCAVLLFFFLLEKQRCFFRKLYDFSSIVWTGSWNQSLVYKRKPMLQLELLIPSRLYWWFCARLQ